MDKPLLLLKTPSRFAFQHKKHLSRFGTDAGLKGTRPFMIQFAQENPPFGLQA
ncbi:hypothetical protein Bsel_1427 [[Bacillus] selenitireducens MLS10]|uniref:Uncharacterized protein n=1 Tax=Bacillus selenitireducens (strain ATCC 700615 / DSM 15326 / MLS10) TaxID=439292 RepID=D6XT03_BACIE|nr:hypothetical protein Bsel_1427 [[Bacillus] selenitireducens MLS10]